MPNYDLYITFSDTTIPYVNIMLTVESKKAALMAATRQCCKSLGHEGVYLRHSRANIYHIILYDAFVGYVILMAL